MGPRSRTASRAPSRSFPVTQARTSPTSGLMRLRSVAGPSSGLADLIGSLSGSVARSGAMTLSRALPWRARSSCMASFK